MKKILFLLLIVAISSCRCLLGQIPPQYVYVGENCQATLPNYLLHVTASDNCTIASLTQTPLPGSILTAANMITNVEIKATDAVGNTKKINFTVTLIDTIPPIITVDNTLITGDTTMGIYNDFDIINALYNQADRIIANKLDEFDGTFPYSELGLPVLDSSYYKKYMVTITSPGYAKTGIGGRIFQWDVYNINDTIPQ